MTKDFLKRVPAIATRFLRETADLEAPLAEFVTILTKGYDERRLQLRDRTEVAARITWGRWICGEANGRTTLLPASSHPNDWSIRSRFDFRVRDGIFVFLSPDQNSPRPSAFEVTEYCFNPRASGLSLIEGLDEESEFDGAVAACIDTQWPGFLSALGACGASLLLVRARAHAGRSAERDLSRDVDALRETLMQNEFDTRRIGAVLFDVLEPAHLRAITRLEENQLPFKRYIPGAEPILAAAARRHAALMRVLKRACRDVFLLDAETETQKFMLAVPNGFNQRAVLDALADCTPLDPQMPSGPINVQDIKVRDEFPIGEVETTGRKKPTRDDVH